MWSQSMWGQPMWSQPMWSQSMRGQLVRGQAVRGQAVAGKRTPGLLAPRRPRSEPRVLPAPAWDGPWPTPPATRHLPAVSGSAPARPGSPAHHPRRGPRQHPRQRPRGRQSALGDPLHHPLLPPLPLLPLLRPGQAPERWTPPHQQRSARGLPAARRLPQHPPDRRHPRGFQKPPPPHSTRTQARLHTYKRQRRSR
jgi:hypothetical protein